MSLEHGAFVGIRSLELWRQSHRPELHEESLNLTCVPRWLLDAKYVTSAYQTRAAQLDDFDRAAPCVGLVEGWQAAATGR